MDANWKRSIGARVRAARDARGMTQEQLAAAIDQATRTVSYLETGTKVPTLQTLMRIAGVLERPLSFFLSEQDADDPDPERLRAETRITEIIRHLAPEDVALVLGHAELLLRTREAR